MAELDLTQLLSFEVVDLSELTKVELMRHDGCGGSNGQCENGCGCGKSNGNCGNAGSIQL